MNRRRFLFLFLLIFFLNNPAPLSAYGEVGATNSKTDDSSDWLNHLYQRSGRSIPSGDASEEAPGSNQIADNPMESEQTFQTIQEGAPSDNSAPESSSSENSTADVSNPDPEKINFDTWSKETTPLQGDRVKVSGRYRLAAGVNSDHFIANDSNSDLQDRDYHFVFGERLNNTYDPAIYSQYLLNVDFSPLDKMNIYTQIVADPWSYVGQTGEQVKQSDIGGEVVRYNLKYFGANNSTIAESYRTTVADQVGFPVMKIKDGQTPLTTIHGFYDFNQPTGGIPFTIPQMDLDYEFRPIRKFWVDYNEDQWHARVFALADQNQALTTDDPLQLSNHKDYWQQSPWLYQYQPIQFYSDGSIQRGYYSDTLSFFAQDSEGNRLVLLKGVSVEADLGKTYIASTVAAPYTPWDEKYFEADNIPGVVRIKHQATDKLMVGGTYGFRNGLVKNSLADFNQVIGVDAKYQINQNVKAKAEVAGSHRERDIQTNQQLRTSTQGYAYKTQVEGSYDHKYDGHTDFQLSFTQMDQSFDPSLSRYSNTRDDHSWGNHITFRDYSPDLEAFRLGDGVDINRFVIRFDWKEKLFKDKFMNLFDIRNVHKENNTAYKETVLRDEATYKFDKKTTFKGLFRWQGLPQTTPYIEPFLSNYYFLGLSDPSSATFQNIAVPADVDPSRFTYSGGVQYVFNPQWTGEGAFEYTNDIPDFPRGILNGNFRDANDRVDGLLLDHITNFLYGQSALGGVPPYKYFNVFRERVIYKPEIDSRATVTFHAAQNSYKFATGIDDNMTHQGISLAYNFSKKLSFFTDLTHSQLIDLPRLITTNYQESNFDDHYNFYASADYKISASSVFRAEYGLFGLGLDAPQINPYSATAFSLPTIDTEHLFRVSLSGDF